MSAVTALDHVIQAERNEYHEYDLKIWALTVEEAAIELAALRARANEVTALRQAVNEAHWLMDDQSPHPRDCGCAWCLAKRYWLAAHPAPEQVTP